MRKVVVDCCKKNNDYLNWSPYFNEVEKLGLDKYSDLVVEKKVDKLQKEVKQVEIVSEIDQKLKRLESVIALNVRKLEALKLIKEERELTKFERETMEFEESLLKQRLGMQLKYATKKDEDGELDEFNDIVDISQADKKYRSLYLKIERDGYELNNWKRILEDIESVSLAFRDDTIKICNIKIPQYTRSIAMDLGDLSRLEAILEQESKEKSQVSDNFKVQENIIFDEGQVH
jgi:hypothetical protein